MATNLDALQHAAELSYLYPTIERTLGPDKPDWRETEKLKNANNKNIPIDGENTLDVTNNNNVNTKTTTITALVPAESNFPDIHAINKSMLSRSIELECKRNIRQQLNELQQKQFAANEKLLRERKEQIADRKKWLLEKLKADEMRISKAAEQKCQAELLQQQQELDSIRKQSHEQLQQMTFKGVMLYQKKFRERYDIVAKLLVAISKDGQQQVQNDHNRQLHELVQLFDQLIRKLNSGACGIAELKTAEKFCVLLERLEVDIIKVLDKNKAAELEAENRAAANAAAAAAEAVAQEEKKQQKLLEEQKERELQQQQLQKQQQEQQQQQQLQQQQQQQAAIINAPAAEPISTTQSLVTTETPTTAINTPSTNDVTDSENSSKYVDPKRLTFYNQINELYLAKVERIKPLQKDDFKKYRSNCQKAINIPLNAISSVSGQHLLDKYQKLYNFISGEPYKSPDGPISINDHPLARDYCILLMAKKFVSQAETSISSNPQAAFPIASVIVSLWKVVPDFGQTLLAYIFKESPFLVPYFIPQKPGQSNEEYFKVIGYRLVEGNQFEKPDMYLKRQAGLARLYGAIMISNGRSGDNTPHPYGIVESWRWLTHIVNLSPLPDICATIIMEILQIVGSELWRYFGTQFPKLLIYIQQHYFPRLNAIDNGGPKTRLELLLGKFIREGKIPQAAGVLPNGFW